MHFVLLINYSTSVVKIYMFTVATAKQRRIGTLECCLFIH